MIDDTMTDAELRMSAAVDHVRAELAKIRTGRANPGLVNDLPVDYYGAKTPLQQLAGVTVPEARMLLISPYDAGALKEIERALNASDLGVNPSNDGNVIRVVFPDLTEERRREFVKLAKDRAEDGRISIRNVRRTAKTEFARLAEDGDISEDDERRADKALQDMTDKYVAKVDQLVANKEKELLEV